jgi:hypothetical protein
MSFFHDAAVAAIQSSDEYYSWLAVLGLESSVVAQLLR